MLKDNEHHSAEGLMQYLHRRKIHGKREIDSYYEKYMFIIGSILSLRSRAEEYWGGSPKGSIFNYYEHKYLANNLNGPLPIDLEDVDDELNPQDDRPPRSLILQVAAHATEEVRLISAGLRRVLSRERLFTPVSNAQQIDTYCIRWLMRQPGRNLAEKAGSKQRIMAVVRREQFNTLENRVLKDFLIRSINLADSYLSSLEKRFKNNECIEYRSVRQFMLLCSAVLEMPEMDTISEVYSLPQPNYVLQQDNRYSKIWKMYCKIIFQSRLAEILWDKRENIYIDIDKVKNYAKKRTSCKFFKYKSNVWINPIDKYFSEPFENFLTDLSKVDERVVEKRKLNDISHMIDDEIGVIDLTGEDVFGDYLVEGGIHYNAKPRIEDQNYPFLDDILNRRLTNRHEIVKVCSKEEINKNLADDNLFLKYASQLLGEYKNACHNLKEIVILSPDDWDVYTQESVIRSFSDFGRGSVHLLWRSIAAVLGYQEKHRNFISKHIRENNGVLVADFRNDGTFVMSLIQYLIDEKSQRLIPQRAVFSNKKRHRPPHPFKEWIRIINVLNTAKAIDYALITGCIPDDVKNGLMTKLRENNLLGKVAIESAEDDWLLFGSRVFCKFKNKEVLYYDELEPMYIIAQSHGRIESSALIERNKKCEGGREYTFKLEKDKIYISAGQKGIKFLFHIGALDDQTELHSYFQELVRENPNENIQLSGSIKVSPGQGLAITKVSSDDLSIEIELDYLRNMKKEGDTIERLRKEIQMSYPPSSSKVEAYDSGEDYNMYNNNNSYSYDQIKNVVNSYIKRNTNIPGDLFCGQQRIRKDSLRPTDSQLRLLDRRNIFGINSKRIRPVWLTEEQEEQLLLKLNLDYKKTQDDKLNKYLRLLAWTYRGDNKYVQEIVKIIADKYYETRLKKEGINQVECSLLSNTLNCNKLIKYETQTIETFRERLKRGNEKVYDYRLLYNIEMFDSELFDKINLPLEIAIDICTEFLKKISYYRLNKRPNLYNFALRCFLYFLRYREKRNFFLRDDDFYDYQSEKIDTFSIQRMSALYKNFVKELSKPGPYESDQQELIRKATLKFLTGKGQLTDLVCIVSNDNDN